MPPIPYDAHFLAAPLNKLRKYALVVPSGPANYMATIVTPNVVHVGGAAPVLAPVLGAVNGTAIDGLRHCDWSAHAPAAGVYNVTLQRYTATATVGGISAFTHKHAVVLDFAGGGAGFNAYFLPWDPLGGDIHMTLGGGADYFFTATLSGCTVVVTGPPAAPTVHHLGADLWAATPYCGIYGNPAPAGANTHLLWEDLFDHVAAGGGAVPATRIDKRYYVNDYNPADTERARGFEPVLRAAKHDPTATAIPFGAVFGLRDPNPPHHWTFYLSENAGLRYRETHVQLFGWPPGAHVVNNPVVWKIRSRPLLLREVYPNAPAAFNAPAGAPPLGVAALGGAAGQCFGRRWTF